MAGTKAWSAAVSLGLVNFGIYLAFASNTGIRELAAGIVTTGLATGAAVIVARVSGMQFEFRLKDVAQAWRLPWSVFADTAKVLSAAAKQLRGRADIPGSLVAVHFDAGDRESALDAGRRALAVTYNSAAPNSIVLGVVDSQGLMIVHRLVPGPLSPMLVNLGAHP